MKLCFISDTHMHHRRLKLEPCDILFHTGDFSMSGYLAEAAPFVDWLSIQKAEYKVFISGNHDFCCQREKWDFLELVLRANARAADRNVVYLQDKACRIKGLNIYGSPWQPWFHDWAWNFSQHPARYEIQAKACWDMIPKGLDLLLTHGPPKRMMDLAPHPGVDEDPHVGCKYLLDAVAYTRPKIHAFGHIHEGYGEFNAGHTRFINASTLDGSYKELNEPIYVEIPDDGRNFTSSADNILPDYTSAR